MCPPLLRSCLSYGAMKRGLVLLGALALLGSAACSQESVPMSGRRVISLAPSITRILQALNAQGDLVGVDTFSSRLPGLGSVPSVGGFYNPDLERIVELSPSLVIAVWSEQQHTTLASLGAHGIRIEEIAPDTLEEVLETFVFVGALVERAAEADALVARVRAGLEAVRRSVAGRASRTTAIVLEREPLYVVGGGSFAHALVEIAGGRNVFGDLTAPYPSVSLEVLASRAPDVIIDTALDPRDRESADSEARRFWSRFGWARAVEVVPRRLVTLPGPDLPEAARVLRDRLHPQGTER